MRTEEIRLLNLLDEIKIVCDGTGADYYVIGDELLYFFLKKRPFSCEADVCVFSSRSREIIEILKEKKGRKTEQIPYSTESGPSGIFYRYADENSLMLFPEMLYKYDTHGIAVNIFLIEEDDTDPQQTKLMFFNGEVFRADREFWGKKQSLTIGTGKYDTVADAGKFLYHYYGREPGEIPVKNITDRRHVIIDADVPFGDIVDKIRDAGYVDKEYTGASGRFFNEHTVILDKLREEEKKINNIVFLVRSEVSLWKKYFFRKEEIMRLYDDGRYDELYLLFNVLKEETDKYIKYGSVPCFDKEIMKIYCKVLKEQGESDAAQKISEKMKGAWLDSAGLRRYCNAGSGETVDMRDYVH